MKQLKPKFNEVIEFLLEDSRRTAHRACSGGAYIRIENRSLIGPVIVDEDGTETAITSDEMFADDWVLTEAPKRPGPQKNKQLVVDRLTDALKKMRGIVEQRNDKNVPFVYVDHFIGNLVYDLSTGEFDDEFTDNAQ